MSDWIKATCMAVTLLVGGAVWAITNFAGKDDIVRLDAVTAELVPAAEYDKHLENEESRYVLALKKEIRELQRYVRANPQDRYAADDLDDMINTLCEIRPSDRLCK